MKRKYYVFLICFGLVFCISGCNDHVKTEFNQSNITATDSVIIDSSSYAVNNEINPKINDESIKYKNIELIELNKKNNYKPITDIYFLDNDNIIFSTTNGKKETDDNENCDLYKYNIKSNVLTLLCPGFILYYDSYIKVKDPNNFSIVRNGIFLNIEDNKVKIKRNIFNDAKKKYQYVTDAFYNEENNKILILTKDLVTKTNGAFINDSDFSNTQKLPFTNIYRVQWADKDNIIVAYKDSNGKTLLVTYNILNEYAMITTLPDKNYFIDPVLTDNGIIKFLYLDDPRTEMPWGFLDLNKGIIDRVYFESCNPTSIVRNGRMGGFFELMSKEIKGNKLFLYDNSTKNITIRNNSVDNPQALAVSPDGNTIVYVAGNYAGESRVYINKI